MGKLTEKDLMFIAKIAVAAVVHVDIPVFRHAEGKISDKQLVKSFETFVEKLPLPKSGKKTMKGVTDMASDILIAARKIKRRRKN